MRRWGCYEYSIFILGLIFIGAMGFVAYLFVVIGSIFGLALAGLEGGP